MRLFSLLFSLFFLGAIHAQDAPATPANTPTTTEPQESEKLKALTVITDTLRVHEAERTVQRDLLKKATTDEQKVDITAEIDRLSAKIKEIKLAFTTTATGINPNDSQTEAEKAQRPLVQGAGEVGERAAGGGPGPEYVGENPARHDGG